MSGVGPRGRGVKSSTPLQGALLKADDTQESLLLEALVARLEGYERTQRLMLEAMQSLSTATQEQISTLQHNVMTEIAREKQEAARAADEARLKFEELLQQKPLDPATKQAMLQAAMKDAEKQLAQQAVAFKELLRDMPRGDIMSHEPEAVRFIINGEAVIIRPGLNTNIPEAFIEAWERRDDHRKWAADVEKSFRRFDDQGNPRSANDINIARGVTTVWNEDAGVVG
jgi:hypothetical protein